MDDTVKIASDIIDGRFEGKYEIPYVMHNIAYFVDEIYENEISLVRQDATLFGSLDELRYSDDDFVGISKEDEPIEYEEIMQAILNTSTYVPVVAIEIQEKQKDHDVYAKVIKVGDLYPKNAVAKLQFNRITDTYDRFSLEA